MSKIDLNAPFTTTNRKPVLVVRVSTRNFFRGNTLSTGREITKLKRRSIRESNSLLEEFDFDAYNALQIDNIDQVKDGIYELVRTNETYNYCEYREYDFDGWTLVPID